MLCESWLVDTVTRRGPGALGSELGLQLCAEGGLEEKGPRWAWSPTG